MSAVPEVLNNTDWALLAKQKEVLVDAAAWYRVTGDKMGSQYWHDKADALDGLLHFIDALQDAAHEDGWPVVFLAEGEKEE